jgi:hypothetical protein
MIKDNVVIITDLSVYLEGHREPVPFKATVEHKDKRELDVVSLATGNEYTVPWSAVLESRTDEELKRILRSHRL